jgi:hypothetical protein
MVFQSISVDGIKCLLTGKVFEYTKGNMASRQNAEASMHQHQGSIIDEMREAGVLLPVDDVNNLTLLQKRYRDFLSL